MQLDLCAFGVSQNQKAGAILESFTPEPVMYFLFQRLVLFCFVFSLLYNIFVCVVYFWKQVMRCKNLYVRDYFDDTFIFA